MGGNSHNTLDCTTGRGGHKQHAQREKSETETHGRNSKLISARGKTLLKEVRILDAQKTAGGETLNQTKGGRGKREGTNVYF